MPKDIRSALGFMRLHKSGTSERIDAYFDIKPNVIGGINFFGNILKVMAPPHEIMDLKMIFVPCPSHAKRGPSVSHTPWARRGNCGR